jgi:hypothetical protein
MGNPGCMVSPEFPNSGCNYVWCSQNTPTFFGLAVIEREDKGIQNMKVTSEY